MQTIFIAKKPPEGGWPEKFAVITACNPMSSGERQDDAAAKIRLRKRISRGGYKRHLVTGASPDWRHQEVGFVVWNLSLEEAVAIGREFQQMAVFWDARACGSKNQGFTGERQAWSTGAFWKLEISMFMVRFRSGL